MRKTFCVPLRRRSATESIDFGAPRRRFCAPLGRRSATESGDSGVPKRQFVLLCDAVPRLSRSISTFRGGVPRATTQSQKRLLRQVSKETCRNRLPAARLRPRTAVRAEIAGPGFEPGTFLTSMPKRRVRPLGQAGAAGVWGVRSHGSRSTHRSPGRTPPGTFQGPDGRISWGHRSPGRTPPGFFQAPAAPTRPRLSAAAAYARPNAPPVSWSQWKDSRGPSGALGGA